MELVAVAIPVETMAVVTSITSITIMGISLRFGKSNSRSEEHTSELQSP